MFRNSGNSRTSDAHRLKLNLMDKMNLPRGDNSVLLSDLSICKEYKKVIQEQWIKICETTVVKSLSCLIVLFAYHTSKIILSASRSMKHSVISHQSKYMSTKLQWKLNLGTIFSFWHLWIYSGVQNKKWTKTGMTRCIASRKFWGGISSL